ncbi:FadR/GntR family transcriptional regulator [Arthrobacter sp. ISL-69]|uniref:FadR/GntR family transcriptional regulator n=1 Tax=Arthrobacter sp. ISL-69 TaxID=2819113 RepID=UPI001BE5E87C|nr:GntR family transcriptional regulator [Arthrobacter sp. ISL-69]MBT2534830.1 FadR family transcriptional regulator [Arthrobacter sp. ISL-69]
MTFSPVQKVSAYESIVKQVESAIESGELKPGDRLPSERQLMGDFSVSRATVREALRVLQANDIIESRPGDPKGPVVMPYSPRVLEKAMARLANLEGISRVELLQFRLLIEGHSCMLAAINRSEEDLAQIRHHAAALKEVAAAQVDGPFGQHVDRFHAAIRRASGNRLMEVCGTVVGGIMTDLVDRRLSVDSDRRSRLERSARDASLLVAAIANRQAKEAGSMAVSNIYRYYADDLDAAEKRALAAFMEMPHGVE